MLEYLSVVTFGGLVLFETQSQQTADDGRHRAAVSHVVQEILLEDRVGETSAAVQDFKLQWHVSSDCRIFVIAVMHSFVRVLGLDAALAQLCAAFAKRFPLGGADEAAAIAKDYSAFNEDYVNVTSALGAGTATAPHAAALKGAARTEDSGSDDPRDDTAPKEATPQDAQTKKVVKSGDALVTAGGRVIQKKGRPGESAQGQPSSPALPPTTRKGKPGKPGKAAADEPAVPAAPEVVLSAADKAKIVEAHRNTYIKRDVDGKVSKIEESNWGVQRPRGRVATWLRSHFGTSRQLDVQDFADVVPKLRDKLISKNVAVEVADSVCKSVQSSLANTKIGTFESLEGVIEQALVEALRRILRPKRDINILRDVDSARARRRPFSIVVCGVNGVGKSTSLAKLTYWLQQNTFSVLLAAGDTFRHGAVEQLEVHGNCLGVDVFQMGYGTDPSAVAAAAMTQAAKSKTDVVLIDTAGRMQDHESRMRALAKLIHDNQPDLVLFVGEALVGNTGVDQLRRFNQCLHDFTPVGMRARGIDGIILTKFDTIDDKVGAAVSMVYELGQPIVFVGVGQTYQDLKVIDADVVVSALMQ